MMIGDTLIVAMILLTITAGFIAYVDYLNKHRR